MDRTTLLTEQSCKDRTTRHLSRPHLEPCAQTALVLWRPPSFPSSAHDTDTDSLTILPLPKSYSHHPSQDYPHQLILNPVFQQVLTHAQTVPRLLPSLPSSAIAESHQEVPSPGLNDPTKVSNLSRDCESGSVASHPASIPPKRPEHSELRSANSFDSLASFCTQPDQETSNIKMNALPSSPRTTPWSLPSSPNGVIEVYGSPPRKMDQGKQINLFARRPLEYTPSSPPATPHSAVHAVQLPASTTYTPPENTVYPSPQLTRSTQGVSSLHTPHSPYFVSPPIRVPSVGSDTSSRSSNVSEINQKHTDEEEDTARMDQWKVGKRPGHQGSFVKQSESQDDGYNKKRTLNESIHVSAERVLKKPFRAPQVIPKKDRANQGLPLPCRSSQASAASSQEYPGSSSLSKSSHISDNMRKEEKVLAKPFKTPTRIHNQFTPPSTVSRGGNTVPKTTKPVKPLPNRPRITLAKSKPKEDDDKTRIDKLEKRERVLREALKYVNDPDEEEQISESTEKWLSVGRVIVGRLFELAPRPEADASNMTSRHQAQGGFGWGFDPSFGYGDSRSSYYNNSVMEYTPLSEAQKEFLKTVDRNEDGDPIDADGNLLMGDMGSGDYTGVFNTGEDGTRGNNQVSFRPDEMTEPPIWNPAVMLKQLGVDPGVLGWNDELEDWD